MKYSIGLYPTNTDSVHGFLFTCNDTGFQKKVLEYVDNYLAPSHVIELKPGVKDEQPPVLIVFDFDKKERLDVPSNARAFMAQNYFLPLKDVVKYLEKTYVKD